MSPGQAFDLTGDSGLIRRTEDGVKRCPVCQDPAVFDHVTIRVSDRAASERFYETVLAALGHAPTYRSDESTPTATTSRS
jgi:hypothetical protein